MNSTFAEVSDSPRAAAAPAERPPGRVLFTLLQRELWEHRYLWVGPLCVAALLALCAVIGQVHLDLRELAQLGEQPARVALLTVVQWALSTTFFVLTLFIISNYALDCLYAERKDRSILFWKSLPVSDGLTVGAKLLTALVVVPLGVFAISVLASLVFFAIVSVRTAMGNIPSIMAWDTLEWLRTELAMLLILLIALLWYAPLVAYLMVVSAWARRRPFLLATLPWVLAPILERIAFGTRYLWHFLIYRSNGIFATLAAGHARIFSHHGIRSVGSLLADLNFRAALTDIDLWLGLAAAAALLYAAARIRRYRDDT
jgi:ABC-2 type transport system permease protein